MSRRVETTSPRSYGFDRLSDNESVIINRQMACLTRFIPLRRLKSRHRRCEFRKASYAAM
eukprot:9486103-Pyramimonas_sp.AAC.2